MDFNEYQEAARKTAIYPNKGSNIEYPTLGLNGEAGEVAEKVKKMLRDDHGKLTEKRRQEVIKELGDCMWYISALCDEVCTTMNFVAKTNIEKLSNRQKTNNLQGSGDNR